MGVSYDWIWRRARAVDTAMALAFALALAALDPERYRLSDRAPKPAPRVSAPVPRGVSREVRECMRNLGSPMDGRR